MRELFAASRPRRAAITGMEERLDVNEASKALLKIFQLYRQRRKQIQADAEALMVQFGERAYAEARQRAHDARQGSIIDDIRPKGHWERVRALIGRKAKRRHLNTATRYLS